MKKVKLRELLGNVPVGAVSDPAFFENFDVASISTDSRSLKKGELFVALRGQAHDGHEHIAGAVKGGASGVVYETAKLASFGGKFPRGILFVGVENTRNAFGRMAENYLRFFRLHKIAITGSAGKTTTTRLVASVLARKLRVIQSPRSFNNDIGVPKTLFGVDEGTEVLVQEIGTNHPGEIAYLSGIIRQDSALITNIGPAHVGFFGSVEAIAREKKDAIACLGREGTAFLNAEDAYFDSLRAGIEARVSSFGLSKGDLFPERILDAGFERVEFVLEGQRMRARLSGLHGVLDAVAAALVGMSFGLTLEQIGAGIEDYSPEEGRGNVYDVGGVTLIDESYNANPLSVRASLECLGRTGAEGKKVFVFADMLELGEEAERYHQGVADDVLKNGISRLLTVGELAKVTGAACRGSGLAEVRHFQAVEDAAACLKDEIERGILKRGDVVLVKGSRAMRLDRVVRGLIDK